MIFRRFVEFSVSLSERFCFTVFGLDNCLYPKTRFIVYSFHFLFPNSFSETVDFIVIVYRILNEFPSFYLSGFFAVPPFRHSVFLGFREIFRHSFIPPFQCFIIPAFMVARINAMLKRSMRYNYRPSHEYHVKSPKYLSGNSQKNV